MDELFPYQEEGAQWLTTKRFALLADEPGLGKSAQAIVAADRIGAQRIVVLCPASVRINWTREFAKWSGLTRPLRPLMNSQECTETTSDSFWDGVVVSSYDLILRATSLMRNIDLLILDESHYLKSIEAKRAHAVLARGGLIHQAKRTWALSGTPAPNNASELYPLMRCFGATSLRYDQFVTEYCATRHTQFGPTIVGNRNVAALRAALHPLMLRRKKVDVMTQLPAISFHDLTVEPAVVDEELYFADYYLMKQVDELHKKLREQQTGIDTLLDLTGSGRDGVKVMEGMAKSVSTILRYTGISKAPPLIDIVKDELDNNHYEKIVIFAIHRDVIEQFRVGLNKFKPVTLYGGTPADKRQANIDRFIKDKKCRVFIGNIDAAGTGIDGMQHVCHEALFAEYKWTPGPNAQAAMRIHRIGQTKPVRVRIALAADTYDERVGVVVRRKTKDLTEILD